MNGQPENNRGCPLASPKNPRRELKRSEGEGEREGISFATELQKWRSASQGM